MDLTKKPLNVFELEQHGIPFEEWCLHKDKLPKGVWALLENHMTDMDNYGPIYGLGCMGGTLLGWKEGVGYFIVGSGQGPFMVWMENPQRVSGPYPFEGNKKYDYDDVEPEKKFLNDREWNKIDEQSNTL